jgi:hypothetical protein
MPRVHITNRTWSPEQIEMLRALVEAGANACSRCRPVETIIDISAAESES